MKMPPMLASLFAGTALTAVTTDAPPANSSEDNDGAKPGAIVTNADAERIAANAESAVTEAVAATNKRWSDVLTSTTGEGDQAQAIINQPTRAAAALDLLADTSLSAEKIVATVSKPSFAGSPAAGSNGVDPVAAAAARERARSAEQPDTNGSNAGADGTGANGELDKNASVREHRKKVAAERNKQTEARAGGPAAR